MDWFQLKASCNINRKIKLKSANTTQKVKNSFDFKCNQNFLSCQQSYALPMRYQILHFVNWNFITLMEINIQISNENCFFIFYFPARALAEIVRNAFNSHLTNRRNNSRVNTYIYTRITVKCPLCLNVYISLNYTYNCTKIGLFYRLS